MAGVATGLAERAVARSGRGPLGQSLVPVAASSSCRDAQQSRDCSSEASGFQPLRFHRPEEFDKYLTTSLGRPTFYSAYTFYKSKTGVRLGARALACHARACAPSLVLQPSFPTSGRAKSGASGSPAIACEGPCPSVKVHSQADASVLGPLTWLGLAFGATSPSALQ